MQGIPIDPGERSEEDAARWILAQLIDWHRRENKATWWEGFRLAELDDEELLDERAGLGGLRFVQRVAIVRQIPVDRYRFEEQETEVRAEKDLYHRGVKVGSVTAIDPVNRTIDIKKTRRTADVHPTSIYMWEQPFRSNEHADSLMRIGTWVADNSVEGAGVFRAVRDLLLRRPPRLYPPHTIAALVREDAKTTACRVATELDHSVFAIQGPPGAGKTFTGTRMICELARQGRRIGITALSHKVIRKLLDEIVNAAHEDDIDGILCMQRSNEEEDSADIAIANDNATAWAALRSRSVNVVGGTSWLWAPAEASETVDVLFIDEAGQMALADVVAVAQAARNVVLIGDPQQLERPLKGSHPPGPKNQPWNIYWVNKRRFPKRWGYCYPKPGDCTRAFAILLLNCFMRDDWEREMRRAIGFWKGTLG